jgi:membrane associated rhomboid family serine protease
MLIPVNVDVPMTRLPIANWALIGLICCITFLGWADTDFRDTLAGIEYRLQSAAPTLEDWEQLSDEEIRALLEEAIERGAVLFGPQPVFEPPWWKLPILAVTSSLLHADPFHLIGNMLFLWVFGNAVNYKFGHLVYLGLVLLAAMVSGVAFYWAVPGQPVVGASGAIMAVVGAYLVFFPRNDVTIAYFLWFYVWGSFRASSWIMILFWVAFDLLYLLLGVRTGVAYVSHVAGFLAGFAIAFLFAWWRIFQPTRYEQTLLEVFGSR